MADVEKSGCRTNCGVLGKVSKIADAYVTVEVANNVEIVVQRPAIQLVLPKGTIKGI